jgi:methylglutaconyl-CoA hydratase
MNAGRIDACEALRIGFAEESVEQIEEIEARITVVSNEVLSTGPCAVAAAKELTFGFDRWRGSDEELREWTLDFTSRMRSSVEGQEGLSSFLEKRPTDWKPEE